MLLHNEFFYTYAQTFKSRVFLRGYIDGKRFNQVRGGMPFDGRCSQAENDARQDLINQNRCFTNHSVSFYIRRSDYIKQQGYIDQLLKYQLSYNNKPLDCEINLSDKTDIYNTPMVEIKHLICRDDIVRRTLNNEQIEIFDDILPNVKLTEQLQRRKDFKVNFDKIKVGFFDIEIEQETGKDLSAQEANERINVITVKIKGDKIYTFGLGNFNNTNPNVEYYGFSTERELLTKFIDKLKELDIDVISGWNSIAFDIPYIINRCRKILGNVKTNELSPFKFIESRQRRNKYGMLYNTYNVIGISHLDYMDLYQLFSYTPRESYSLNNICQAEIGKGKLDYSEYGNLRRLYRDDFQKFVEYNIRDVTILEELDQKMNLINLAMHIGYKCQCGFEEVASPIRTWDNYIYTNFASKNLVLPPYVERTDTDGLMGGHVKLPTTGIYNWVVSFDVNSLYPTIIRQLNLSPETFTDEVDTKFEALSPYSEEDDPHRIGALIDCIYDTSYLKERDLCLTCNGNLIKRDKQGFLPEMIGDLYNSRVVVKGKMKQCQRELEQVIKNNPDDIQKQNELKNQISTYKNEQMAIKVLMNSLYGQLGNKFCRWYDIRIPRSITKTGQTIIRYIARKMNEFLNSECHTDKKDYVIAIDTDSNYLNLENIVNSKGFKTVDELNVYVEEVLEPYIDKCFREFYDYMNHFDFQLKMKRECIADRGLFINKKKRYALSVIDMEGVRYAEPHMKIMGLEVIKSSTPEGVRDALTKVLKIMLYKDKSELVNYIESFRDEFNKLPPHLIAINKRVSEINKWMTPQTNKLGHTIGIPINSKAAINFNKLASSDEFKHLNLRKIEAGDKIKYIYLTSNPYGFDVIGFVDYLNEDLGLNEYIDYQRQFDKVFLENVKNITDDFGYDLSTPYTIDDLF